MLKNLNTKYKKNKNKIKLKNIIIININSVFEIPMLKMHNYLPSINLN